MHPKGQSLYSHRGPNPGLSVTRTAGAGYPPPPRLAVTKAELGGCCGNQCSSPTLSQAPRPRASVMHLQLLLHPVESLVDVPLGHFAFLCQLGSLHRAASILQRLQDPLIKVWERRKGQGED